MTRSARAGDGRGPASPDRLDEYVRVSMPAAWIALAAVALLVAAAAAWGTLGSVEDVREVHVVVGEGGSSTVYVDAAEADGLEAGCDLVVAGARFELLDVDPRAVPDSALDLPASPSGWYVTAGAQLSLPPGTYGGELAVASYSPLEFLLGGA